MSGEQLSRNWWIGLEFKNDTRDVIKNGVKVDVVNNWVWLDGSLVDTGVT